MSEASPYPVIVIGMHRSGTGLVSRALERLGVLMGRRKEVNHEALFFLRLNEWILAQAGASWDFPVPADRLVEDEDLRALVVKSLRGFLASPRLASYLGAWRYFRLRRLDRLEGAWGFKDPRTTITLPLWRDVFPGARVVHVYRNGVDVAQSLVTRMRSQLEGARSKLDAEGTLGGPIRGPYPRVADSIRFAELQDGFRLWEIYLERAKRHLEKMPEERRLEIRYEDLLAEPEEWLERLAALAGVEATAEDLAAVRAGLDASRANAWKGDAELEAFHERVRSTPRMRELGY